MLDIMLDSCGDLKVSDTGDISLTESVRQAILIRLRWIYSEWRLGPELGFPWFEEVFIKNPDIPKIKRLIRNEIMQVEGVKSAAVTDVVYERSQRTAQFRYTCSVGEDTFRDEVTIYA